ncbi:DUF6207 family protein [Streptomyces sp. NPDC088254]|uniref:DUF6207 family protein n=1 Tax=Streptomyces sp. NPDC088254 TaxID=3365847 RepID=UPI00382B72C6
MDPIHETHVSEPGLLVVDVKAADDATALAFVGRGRSLPALLVRQHAGDEGHRAREPALTSASCPSGG